MNAVPKSLKHFLLNFICILFSTRLERNEQRLNEATAFSFGTVSKLVIVKYIGVSVECVRKQRAHLVYWCVDVSFTVISYRICRKFMLYSEDRFGCDKTNHLML
jgi:hypothetical protein